MHYLCGYMKKYTTTSLRIPREVWKEFRKYCIEKELSVGDQITKLLRAKLGLKETNVVEPSNDTSQTDMLHTEGQS